MINDTERIDFHIKYQTTWYEDRGPSGLGILCYGRGRNEVYAKTWREAIDKAIERESQTTFIIQSRRQIEVNTDPQRRCYDGCHFSSELVWTEWEDLEIDVREDLVEAKLVYWKDLNAFAVSQRGAGAKREYRVLRKP